MPFRFESKANPDDQVQVVVKLSGKLRKFIEDGANAQKISKAAAVMQCIEYAEDDQVQEQPEPKRKRQPVPEHLAGHDEELDPEFDED